MPLWLALLVQGIIVFVPSAIALVICGLIDENRYEPPEWAERGARLGGLGVIIGFALGSLSVWSAVLVR